MNILFSFYKTGDLCRQNCDGDILFVGRVDNVVKVRGYRVDLNEIEAVLMHFEQIKQAKVLADEENIYAYFLAATQAVDRSELRKFCNVHLPRYAVPNVFNQLSKMPLTNNNKIDARALLSMRRDNSLTMRRDDSLIKDPSSNEEQKRISQIWFEMFERRVGVDESFFEIGGNSLSAQRMLNRIESVFHLRLSIADLMENPTILELEQFLKRIKRESSKSTTTTSRLSTTSSKSSTERSPLSYQQEQMLFLEEVSRPGEYNLQFVQFFTKDLNIEHLFDALEEVSGNNEILRTRIVENEGEFCQETTDTSPFNRPSVERIANEDLKRLIRDESTRRFDLFSEVPLRVRLFDVNMDVGVDRYCLFVELHHLISDATSTMLMEEQISNNYNDIKNDLPSTTYAQWSAEQKRKKLQFEEMARELNRELTEEAPVNRIRLKDNLKDVSGSIRVFTEEVMKLDGSSTPFVWICTHIACVFSKKFERKTLIIGAPVQNRNEETALVLGNFLNNIIIPLQYDSALNFNDNLKRNEKSVIKSLRYSELPFNFIADLSRSFGQDVYSELFALKFNLD